MVEDSAKSLLYFGSTNGLFIYTGKSFTKFKASNGKKTQLIKYLVFDSNGNLWFGHEEGIGKINLRTKTVSYYGHLEGFTPIEVSYRCAVKDS